MTYLLPRPKYLSLILAYWAIGAQQAVSMPTAFDNLQSQIQADLQQVQSFLNTASSLAKQEERVNLSPQNATPEGTTFTYLESMHAFSEYGHLIVEITFQKSQDNPNISPLLAGKKLRFSGLDAHAQETKALRPKKHTHTITPKKPTDKTKKTDALYNTVSTLRKKLKKAHSEQQVLNIIKKAQKDLSPQSDGQTTQNSISAPPNNTNTIVGFTCSRIADTHGQYFAEITGPTGSIDLFARLPRPYNACIHKID